MTSAPKLRSKLIFSFDSMRQARWSADAAAEAAVVWLTFAFLRNKNSTIESSQRLTAMHKGANLSDSFAFISAPYYPLKIEPDDEI